MSVFCIAKVFKYHGTGFVVVSPIPYFESSQNKKQCSAYSTPVSNQMS